VVLIALWRWGEEACFHPNELARTMVERRQQVPLAKLEPRAPDGRPIGPPTHPPVIRRPANRNCGPLPVSRAG
jgi:hypothetical protein